MKDKNRLDLDAHEKWLDETYPSLPYVSDPGLVQLAYVLIARAQELEIRVAELRAAGWVSVEDRLPQQEAHESLHYGTLDVLVVIHGKFTSIGWYMPHKESEDYGWWIRGENKPCKYVTHWQPLPEPPR